MNFGAFATPEENIVFDINDFDETLPGVDFTMDLKRLAASVAVAALAGNFSKKQARATTVTTAQAYRSRIRALAKLSPLEVWHSRIDLAKEIGHIEDRALRRRLYGIISKADRATRAGRQLSASGEGQAGTYRGPAAPHLSFRRQGRREEPGRLEAGVFRLPKPPRPGAALSRGAICARGRRLQGRRRRQRRDVLRRRPVHERRRRAPFPADQGSGEVGARVPRAEIQGSSGSASGRGPARDAGGERRLPGLDGGWRIRPVFLRAPAQEPAPRLYRRGGGRAEPLSTMRICAGARWRARMRALPIRRC